MNEKKAVNNRKEFELLYTKFMPHKGVDIDVKHNPKQVEKFKKIVEESKGFHCSIKHDGCRGIFKDGEIYTSSMKILPNKKIHEKFAHIKKLTKIYNIILDCEFDDLELDFSSISGILRSYDKDICNIRPYFFDLIFNEEYTLQYKDRFVALEEFVKFHELTIVESKICDSYDQILEYFKIWVIYYKMKAIVTYDAVIKEIQFLKHRKGDKKDQPILHCGKKMAGTIIGIWKNKENKEFNVKISCMSMKDLEKKKSLEGSRKLDWYSCWI